jgi:hypothetical protein
MKGLEESYQKAMRVVHLHGPSNLTEVIKIANLWAEPFKDVHQVPDNGVDMRWWITLILTDGEIADCTEACDEIVKGSNLPISFVVVGIGKGDFTWLSNLDKEVSQLVRLANRRTPDTYLERKIVHFVRFEDFRWRTPAEFIAAAIGDLPQLVVNYFQWLEIKPWNTEHFEDDVGQPLPVPVVDAPKVEKDTRSITKLTEMTADSITHTDVSGMSGSRRGSKEHGDVDLMEAYREAHAPMSAADMPNFLVDWREQLMHDAHDLGYSMEMVRRVVTEGIPAGTPQVLLDNAIHGGYGKRPNFKELLKEIDLEAELQKWAMEDLRANANIAQNPPALPDDEPPELFDPEDEGNSDDYLAPMRSLGDASPSGSGSRDNSRSGSRISSKDFSRSGSRIVSKDIGGSRISSKEAGGSRISSKDMSREVGGSRISSKDISRDVGGSRISSKDFSHMGSRISSKDGSSKKVSIDAQHLPGTVAKETEPGACTVCMELLIDTVFEPCGHSVTCRPCSQQLGNICPLCRNPILDMKPLRRSIQATLLN